MGVVFIGVIFVIYAVLNWLGKPWMLSKRFRNMKFRKEYQKGLVLPYAIFGVGFIVWGLVYNTYEEQDTLWFCMGLVVIAIISFILLWRNRRKFDL